MSKYLTMDQAIQLFEKMNESSRKDQTQTIVKGLLSAASKSAINGQLTGGDLIVNVGIMGSFVGGGALITIVSMIAGEPWLECRHYIVDLTRGGVLISLARTAIDALDLYSLLGETVGQFLDWVDKKRQTPQRVITSPPIINHGDPKKPQELYLLPNGQQVPASTFRYVLESAVLKGDKFWSREYWCHKPENPDRPGIGILKTRQWAGIKQACFEYTEGTKEPQIWRTNDRHAVYTMLDFLLSEKEAPPTLPQAT